MPPSADTLIPAVQAVLGRMPAPAQAWARAHPNEANERYAVRNADVYAVGFSGGKDSLACALHLLELGIPRERIELWHHAIDPHGRPFMDWPITWAYCRAVAEALGLPLYRSEREGGFEREMLRDGTPTAPVSFETPDGTRIRAGGHGPPGTRLRFPQTSADLSVRWCSAYLKIDVAARVFSNDPRFAEGTFVLVTGERGEESKARANYAVFEPHRAMNRRRAVFQWRPVRDWPEADVWAILQRWGIVPHPAYRIGFGRCSCMRCIFGNPDQWATVRELDPAGFARIPAYEAQFGTTIRRKESVEAAANRGHSMLSPEVMEAAIESQGDTLRGPVRIDPSTWRLPRGAFHKDGGPI